MKAPLSPSACHLAGTCSPIAVQANPEPAHRARGNSHPLQAHPARVALAHVPATLLATCSPPGSEQARPKLFLAVTVGLTGVFVYATGWGAILAVTFVAQAVVVIQADGHRYGLTAMVVAAVTIFLGEV